MKRKQFCVYLVADKNSRVLYVGVTSDLVARMAQHKAGAYAGFTAKYKLRRLLYYEICVTADEAINREKQLKKWHREWKFNLIKQQNPELRDLSEDLTDF